MNRKWFDIAYAMISLVLLLTFGFVVAKAQQRQTHTTFPVFIPVLINEQPAGDGTQSQAISQQISPGPVISLPSTAHYVSRSSWMDLSTSRTTAYAANLAGALLLAKIPLLNTRSAIPATTRAQPDTRKTMCHTSA